MKLQGITGLIAVLFISSCTVGPDYKRPPVVVPPKFKETPKGWKIAPSQEPVSSKE